MELSARYMPPNSLNLVWHALVVAGHFILWLTWKHCTIFWFQLLHHECQQVLSHLMKILTFSFLLKFKQLFKRYSHNFLLLIQAPRGRKINQQRVQAGRMMRAGTLTRPWTSLKAIKQFHRPTRKPKRRKRNWLKNVVRRWNRKTTHLPVIQRRIQVMRGQTQIFWKMPASRGAWQWVRWWT